MCPQAGLSPRLRTLVDSEALLNDGTAYVLFYLLRVRCPPSFPPSLPRLAVLAAGTLLTIPRQGRSTGIQPTC